MLLLSRPELHNDPCGDSLLHQYVPIYHWVPTTYKNTQSPNTPLSPGFPWRRLKATVPTMTLSLSGVGASLGICEWMRLVSEGRSCANSHSHISSHSHARTRKHCHRALAGRGHAASGRRIRQPAWKNSFRSYLSSSVC